MGRWTIIHSHMSLLLLLQAWKREMLVKHPRGLPKDLEEGFALLDDGAGAGWDLAAQLVSDLAPSTLAHTLVDRWH